MSNIRLQLECNMYQALEIGESPIRMGSDKNHVKSERRVSRSKSIINFFIDDL